MSAVVDGLLFAWGKNKDYAERLVADLSEHQMILQPAPEGGEPANHAAWILSHLNLYLPIIESIVQGRSFEDPKEMPFGMLSKPESEASVYASKSDLINTFASGHDAVTEALKGAGDDLFDQPIELPRWKDVFRNAGGALPYLMVLHENMHLGQLSAWRRIQGMPSV